MLFRSSKDYTTIISVANKLPDETLQEDEKLLTLYDLALTRTEAVPAMRPDSCLRSHPAHQASASVRVKARS